MLELDCEAARGSAAAGQPGPLLLLAREADIMTAWRLSEVITAQLAAGAAPDRRRVQMRCADSYRCGSCGWPPGPSTTGAGAWSWSGHNPRSSPGARFSVSDSIGNYWALPGECLGPSVAASRARRPTQALVSVLVSFTSVGQSAGACAHSFKAGDTVHDQPDTRQRTGRITVGDREFPGQLRASRTRSPRERTPSFW
jgi:hypothetical protein